MARGNRDDWTKAVTRLTMPQARRSKYGAVKVEVDGVVFDSKREAARYHELKRMEKAGLIRALALLSRWPLFVQTNVFADEPQEIGAYISDFAYEDRSSGWAIIVEDVKGFKTPLYRWKKKHFEAQFRIQIHEI